MSVMVLCGHRTDWLCVTCARCHLCCKCSTDPIQLAHSNSIHGQQVLTREIRKRDESRSNGGAPK